MTKRRVAIVHGILAAGNGGSEARAMWAAEALKRQFAVSVISPGPVYLDRLNAFYGTSIRPEHVQIRRLHIPRLLESRRAPSALQGAFAARALRALAQEYDVLISTYNLCDFGTTAIQCIADFSWDERVRRQFDPLPAGMSSVVHRDHRLRRAYLRLCQRIGPPSGRNLFSEDMFVANSRWTAKLLRKKYGVAAEVIYPPVTGECSDVPYEWRVDDFVCIGRIAAEKRIERMIRVIGAVRSHGYAVRIRIIGPLDNSHYARTIASLAQRYSEWVLLEGLQAGEEKRRIFEACRYGIHGREGEAFGIAVAEMVKAGCITFAPAEGGPAEILDHEALLYRNDDDAVEKITAVLDSQMLRDKLNRHLRRQAEQFSPESFMAGLRSAVNRFLCRLPHIDSPKSKEPQSALSIQSLQR
jgi:glycosyltransferase involved in cell wall biosynthesis